MSVAMTQSSLEDQIARRKPQPPEPLAPETIRWLAGLPSDVRPTAMPSQYTRIANRMAQVWGTPHTCLGYLEDLLLDRRGDREGFPFEVALELAGLKDHYETVVHPTAQTAWDLIVGMRR